ncbi:MAG: DEAD/DEAH box helicase [Nanoarchaeota archaeon]|nr:DEAD/DEAH box helicase [Nanoarchaeota archaeon]
MELKDLSKDLPRDIYLKLAQEIVELRPAQEKAIKAGLLKDKNMLVCTPTASGKTFIAELAAIRTIVEKRRKVIYIVPLKSLASEKLRQFRQRYDEFFRIAMSIGDLDSADPFLMEYDLIITTSEKLDSLIRHKAPWLRYIGLVVVDEIHLLNDPGRGPTLEILITILKEKLKGVQMLGLSATIGNPDELAEWLSAELVLDSWRPVELKKGVAFEGKVEFY